MKSVLITGANRGIGLAFAEAYVRRGWKVYAACRDMRVHSDLNGLAQAHTVQTAKTNSDADGALLILLL